ncbi:hypothetical protein [Microbacterium sulfonylureivorans]|uniref:hypothetical protein n=1 Tax=Microbacterium sulfonylureivorans TaxID=2486854 RepID=UPI000FD767E2|nr:hypothetical protein [Microbacterium sulfonylureivorans]
MTNESAALYLRDLGDLLRRSAVDARTRRDSALGTAEYDFETGHLTAYHEVISLMQHQAIAFGIGLEDLTLNNINPERDLR